MYTALLVSNMLRDMLWAYFLPFDYFWYLITKIK